MKQIVLAALAAFSLSACVTPPSPEEMARADFGPYPDNWESIIKSYVSTQLKDPYSAQYNFLNAPTRGFHGMGGAKFGWVVCATINAKNSYGGYVGQRLSYFMIRDGRVLDATMGDGSYGDAIAKGKCQGTGAIPK